MTVPPQPRGPSSYVNNVFKVLPLCRGECSSETVLFLQLTFLLGDSRDDEWDMTVPPQPRGPSSYVNNVFKVLPLCRGECSSETVLFLQLTFLLGNLGRRVGHDRPTPDQGPSSYVNNVFKVLPLCRGECSSETVLFLQLTFLLGDSRDDEWDMTVPPQPRGPSSYVNNVFKVLPLCRGECSSETVLFLQFDFLTGRLSGRRVGPGNHHMSNKTCRLTGQLAWNSAFPFWSILESYVYSCQTWIKSIKSVANTDIVKL